MQRCADRLRGAAEADRQLNAQKALLEDLEELLERGDREARGLQFGLTEAVGRIDGFEVALQNATGELRADLAGSFAELHTANDQILDRRDTIELRQAGIGDQLDQMQRGLDSGPAVERTVLSPPQPEIAILSDAAPSASPRDA